MKVIRFAKDYSKMEKPQFSTLRHPLSTKYNEGEIYLAKSPSNNFKVECVNAGVVAIGQLTDKFLMQDTDTKSRYYALKEIMNYYPDLDHCSEVLVVFLKQKECYIKLKNGQVLIEGEDFSLNGCGFIPKKPIPIVELGSAEFSPEFERRFMEMQREGN
ncbi:MAG: hypothetical protein ACC614_02130 [Methanobacterium formicicum]|uniref:hypothetical protein n=1 Tax=Methanobacterium formicicum TaxID=2162 RepID=UPI00353137AE